MGGYSSSWDDSSSYDWSDTRTTTRRSSRDYADDDDRQYTGTSSQGITPPVGEEISSTSPLTAMLLLDVTGSLRRLPGQIIQKIPALYEESNAALQGKSLAELQAGAGESLLEMAVIAFGDAQGDRHPIQVVNYSKGPDLVNGVNKIYPEGRGGGNARESVDLAMYYGLKHSMTPNSKPLAIIVTDEGFYDNVRKDWVKRYTGDRLNRDLNTKNMIKKFAREYDTYVLRPEFPEVSYPEHIYERIHNEWVDVLGHERVMKVRDTERIIDDFIMVCSYASNHAQEGLALFERRQIDPDAPEEGLRKLRQVLDTLHPMIGDRAQEDLERIERKYRR